MKLLQWILWPINIVKDYLATKHQLKKLKERDPFIYK